MFGRTQLKITFLGTFKFDHDVRPNPQSEFVQFSGLPDISQAAPAIFSLLRGSLSP